MRPRFCLWNTAVLFVILGDQCELKPSLEGCASNQEGMNNFQQTSLYFMSRLCHVVWRKIHLRNWPSEAGRVAAAWRAPVWGPLWHLTLAAVETRGGANGQRASLGSIGRQFHLSLVESLLASELSPRPPSLESVSDFPESRRPSALHPPSEHTPARSKVLLWTRAQPSFHAPPSLANSPCPF